MAMGDSYYFALGLFPVLSTSPASCGELPVAGSLEVYPWNHKIEFVVLEIDAENHMTILMD